jgi:chromosome segregation ATPase
MFPSPCLPAITQVTIFSVPDAKHYRQPRDTLSLRIADPSRAFKAAKIAHSQGWRTVHHIRASPIHTYPDLARGFAAIDAASREWSDHRYTLKQLDERIQEQYSALEKMYGQETKLAYRHKLITAELHRLMREADKISGEMLSIKGRYSQEINDLRDDYRADTREVKDATATAQKELEENNEQLALLREKVREAAVKAARYREEAQHSMEDVEGMRSRTLEHEVSMHKILNRLAI